MSDNSLDDLLSKLTQGDADAAEQAFLAYEPYLRMVVRRQLSKVHRAKFDSADIVQSIWADLLSGFRETRWSFQDANHLRAFLVKATRNRFIDRVRQYAPAIANEKPLSACDYATIARPRDERPSQWAQADELWCEILDNCPPTHREVLGLKHRGFSLDEISVRTGLHKSSVRRILYQAANRWSANRSRRER